MRRKNYTLVELLVVIAIIGILAGLLFPALGLVKEKGKITAASQEVQSIQMAVLAFEQEYNRYPGCAGGSGHDHDSHALGDDRIYGCNPQSSYTVAGKDADLSEEYLHLFDLLTYSNHTDAASDPSDDVKKQNSTKKRYLEPSENYFGSAKNGFRDSWGRPYIVIVDGDYDGKVTVPKALLNSSKDEVVFKPVCVISFGPQDQNVVDPAKADKGNFIYSWKK